MPRLGYKLKEVVPWQRFTYKLVKCYRRRAREGRPPYDPAMLLKTLLLAYLYNLSECDVERFWSRARGGSAGRVSECAREDASEDFAESYAFFLTDPDALRDVSPEKHRFLRDRLFKGREHE